MDEKEDHKRRLETNRALTSITTVLGQLATAQLSTMSGFLSHAVGDTEDMRKELTTAMAALREANVAINEVSGRLEAIILADLQGLVGKDGDE
jgi:hypothetical protein